MMMRAGAAPTEPGQGPLGEALEAGELVFGKTAFLVDFPISQVLGDSCVGLLFADELGHQVDEFHDR